MYIANQRQRQPRIVNLNEWGEYVGAQDPLRLERDEVILNIEKNNPVLTSVYTSIYSHLNDWDEMGLCVFFCI